MDGIDDSTGNGEHLGYVPQQTGTRTLACHFLDRTPEIEVDKVRLRLLYYLRRITH